MTLQTEDVYADDFFVVNRWILRCAGLWAPDSRNNVIQILYKSYALLVFLFVNLYFTTTEFVSLMYTYGNIYDLIKNISFALTHLMGAVKVVFWYTKGERLLKIIGILESNEFHYESLDNFRPGSISKQYKVIGIKNSLLFFMLAHLTLSSSYLPPTLTATSLALNENSNKTLPERLPYYSWMPFRYDTPGWYLLAIGYQAGPMFSYAYSIVGMDSLFMNIMNCIGAHLTIIQGAFLSIRNRSLEKNKGPALTDDGLYNSDNLKTIMNFEMKKTCKHLQTVFRVCEELENVHKYLTFAQATATLFILCTCLYLVSTTPVNSKQFYAEIVYMIAMGFQLVLYCWFGNEVTIKAEEMPVYIWQSDWLTADKKFKQMMIFTMLRMKRPLHLTVGEFAPLTLSTFVAIIKASYSFFAVIKNTSD